MPLLSRLPRVSDVSTGAKLVKAEREPASRLGRATSYFFQTSIHLSRHQDMCRPVGCQAPHEVLRSRHLFLANRLKHHFGGPASVFMSSSRSEHHPPVSTFYSTRRRHPGHPQVRRTSAQSLASNFHTTVIQDARRAQACEDATSVSNDSTRRLAWTTLCRPTRAHLAAENCHCVVPNVQEMPLLISADGRMHPCRQC
jgi:hypothetical protein